MLRTTESGNKQSGRAPDATPARAAKTAVQAQSPLARKQSALGNQAIQRLLRQRVLQAKLTVNQPGDVYEREADRVADAVMRMSDAAQIGRAHV